MYHLNAIINQCGNHAANHPCPRQSTDNQQNNQCRTYSGYIIRNSQFKIFPSSSVPCHPYQYTNSRSRKQTNLTSARQRIAAKNTDGDKQ